MQCPLEEYLGKCISMLQSLSSRSLLDGLGELTDPQMKTFVRNRLREETIKLMQFFQVFPITV